MIPCEEGDWYIRIQKIWQDFDFASIYHLEVLKK